MRTLITVGILFLSIAMALRYVWKRRYMKLISGLMNEPPMDWTPPARESSVEKLKSVTFDLLIIGGGCTGVGCALDGATRGLRVALVDAGDFGSGTSSKSTKLVHGGVRYLAKAVSNLDWSQYQLVQQALGERHIMFKISPYLTSTVRILVPMYNKILIPYYYIGLKLYDWLSGLKSLGASHFINRMEAMDAFPYIKRKGLHGAVVYYDGQQHDARNNVMLAVTAAYHGATVVNHVLVKSLVLEDGKAVGATCVDGITGMKFDVRASGIVNSTGCFSDELRRMSSGEVKNVMVQSSGTHIVIPREYTPNAMGFLDPHTGDGRVAFFMPWMGKTLVGATDIRSRLEFNPSPTKDDLDFLIHEVRAYTSNRVKLEKKNVLAIWTGIRPLVRDPNVDDTEAIVRRHFIRFEDNGMLTVTGGKWTIYRKMAEEAIDKAVKVFSLQPQRACITKHIKILGSHGYTPRLYLEVQRKLGVPEDMARRLAEYYGTRAFKLAGYMKGRKLLSEKYLYLLGEIAYCIDNELAVRVCDVLCNRLMLGLLDVREAYGCVGKVLGVFKAKCHWDADRCKKEEAEAVDLLESYGLSILRDVDQGLDGG